MVVGMGGTMVPYFPSTLPFPHLQLPALLSNPSLPTMDISDLMRWWWWLSPVGEERVGWWDVVGDLHSGVGGDGVHYDEPLPHSILPLPHHFLAAATQTP